MIFACNFLFVKVEFDQNGKNYRRLCGPSIIFLEVWDIQITFISCVENCTFFRNVGPTASHCVSHYSKVKTSVICPKNSNFFYSYMKTFCEHSLVSQEILSEKEVSMKYEGYLIKARRNRSL